jgi:hypothetical protein
MRGVLRAMLLLCVLMSAGAKAQERAQEKAQDEDLARLELNATETADNRCRMTFLIENKLSGTIDSLKLDLATFNPEGVIRQRMIIEMGPVRGKRTNVRTFSTDGDCGQLGAILVNEISACAPGDPTVCMDGLALSSRVRNVRLYK